MKAKVPVPYIVGLGGVLLVCSVAMALVLLGVLPRYQSTSLTADQVDALIALVEAYAFGIFPGTSLIILGVSLGWLMTIRRARCDDPGDGQVRDCKGKGVSQENGA